MSGLLGRFSPRQLASSALVTVLFGALLVMAIRADGNIVPELDLHDAGIWVTNTTDGAVGRTNTEIHTVDTRLDAGGTAFDVLQSGATVLVRQVAPQSMLVGIDPSLGSQIPGPELGDSAEVSLGGTTAALFDADTGGLFLADATSSTSALGLDPSGDAPPVHEVEDGGRVAVGPDGVAHLLDLTSGEVTSWSVDGEMLGSGSVPAPLDARAQLTAVGGEPVVLDPEEELLLFPGGGQTDLSDLGPLPVLQQPGPSADVVLLATDDDLLAVPMGGGTPEVLSDEGTGGPAAPVFVAGCRYGAWGGSPTYVQDCGGEPRSGVVPQMTAGDDLQFRVNRQRVTLNDLTDGSQLLFTDQDPIFIDNQWIEALTEELDYETDEEEQEDTDTDPTCDSKDNTDPVAEDDTDSFGTRPGRPVVVYPLRNDEDPDCDVLLISAIEPVDRELGRVEVIDGGRAVQVRVEPGVERLSFDYTVTDGRGGSDAATTTVRVVPEDDNSAPKLPSKPEETTVVTGGTVTHNVLAAAFDPDGDVLKLASVDPKGQGTVRFTAKGDVTFTAMNVPGEVDVTYTVEDDRGEKVDGILRVTVVDRTANHPPNARQDSESTVVGRDVVVDVLDNDSDPDDDALSIVRVDADTDATVRWNTTSPEIVVSSKRAETVNVTYRITDGGKTDEAVLRVDFREPGDQSPPVAVRDEVLLSAGQPAFASVLDNDVDLDGEVLVVQGISDLPSPSPISVVVLRRSILKISAAEPLTEPVEFSYTISDGPNTDVGRVVVAPAPVLAENRPPVIRPDEFSVRAGGIAVLPVLSNDSDPEGDILTINAPQDSDQPNPDRDGLLFLSEGQLRYEAPDEPRATVRLKYDVSDSAANAASAEIVVHVLPADGSRNDPPASPEVIGRTVAGQQVTVPVPITTMDPDGDAVTFLGLGSAPSLGSVVDVDVDQFTYIADDDAAGTDEFTYRVVDQFGAEATGTILIGVAGRARENNDPVPVDDEAIVRPGSDVVIDVLANDSDPDGDQLVISDADEDVPVSSLADAMVTIVDGGIAFEAPSDPDVQQTSFRYVASDGRGGTRAATVTVTFRTDDENRPPVAKDDTIEPQRPGDQVGVPVLANDEDPDDDPLSIEAFSLEGATLSADGTSIQFVMPDTPVQFTYLISDGSDDGTARAAVFVPLVDPDADLPPIARPDLDLEVDLGDSITIDVLDNDEDPEGEDLHLLEILGARHGRVEFAGDSVKFTASEEDYVGDAGFSYLVGDGPDPASANTSIGTARIRITGTVNTPPEFTELAIDVPQGGERAIDLTTGVVDPDLDQEHTFEGLAVDGSGADIGISGTEMTLSAETDAPTGSVLVATFEVSDGKETVPGRVTATVITSEAPLAVLGADLAETIQGEPITIDVLENDTNPLAADGPLEILSVTTPTGAGAGAATVDGDAIEYRPGAEFFGETSFQYTVGDATSSPEREVTGTVNVTVIGRPGVPAAPACIGGENKSVRIQWAAPNANGAPITAYKVRINSEGGTDTRDISNSTTQDIGELTNGVGYTFEVAPINEAVDSDDKLTFSAPSPTCTPDQAPEQPDPPVTDFGDGELAITWTEPVNEGSDLIAYHLTNTTTGETQDFGPTVSETTWTGLENGTSYRFTLVAENGQYESPASTLSTGDSIPAGVPLDPAAPTVQTTPGARDGFLDVDWVAPDENGDDIDRFRITVFRNGVEQPNPIVVNDGSARQTTVSTDNGVPYRFTMEAHNKAGWSVRSPQSAPAQSSAPPDAISAVTATDGDRQSTVTFQTPADNGATITSYQYDINNSGNWVTLTVSGSSTKTGTIGGRTNGTTYRYRVRAVNADGAAPPSPQSNASVPYGTPSAPNPSGTRLSADDGRRLRWTWGTGNGNGRDIVLVERSVDGGSWVADGNGAHEQTFGYDQNHNLRIRVTTSEGDRDISNTSTVRTGPAPRPTITLSRGGAAPEGYWYSVSLENFTPGSSFTLYCHDSVDANFYSQTAVIDGAGRYSDSTLCYSRDGPDHWVTGGGEESNHVEW